MSCRKEVILVDQDGVLADFERGFLDEWKKRYPERSHIPLEQRSTHSIADQYPISERLLIREIMTEEGFVCNLPPITGAIQALNDMRSAGLIVKICTSPLSNYTNCVEEKYMWVEAHLGLEWTRDLILTKDKTLIRGDVLIDDKPSVEGVYVPDWEHVIFDQPYNRNSVDKRRLLNWSHWRDVITVT